MDLTPVASDPAVDFQAPIRVSESNSMDPARLVALAVTSQPLLEPVPADAGDRVDLSGMLSSGARRVRDAAHTACYLVPEYTSGSPSPPHDCDTTRLAAYAG